MAEESCRAITQAAGGHATADQVPGCWRLDLNWTPLYIQIGLKLTIHILISDLRKIRLPPGLPETNYCVSQGVSVLERHPIVF
jgi:hypothetical protein